MGVLCPIVQSLVRAMLDAGHDIALCGAIGSKFIGDYDARRMTLFFEKLFHQPLGGLGIAAALHQHVENKAILIDSPPQPMFVATNGDDDLIEAPFVTKPTSGPSADFAGKAPTEFLCPSTHGLVRNDNATGRQQILDHAQAERKSKVQPNCVGNHLSGKSMAAIKRITCSWCHAARSHRSMAGRLTLQCRLACRFNEAQKTLAIGD